GRVTTTEPDARRIDALLAAVIEQRVQRLAAPLDARQYEWSIVDLHRDAHPRLDKVPLGVFFQIASEISKDSRMRHLNTFIVPVAIPVDAEVGKLPVDRRRRHQLILLEDDARKCHDALRVRGLAIVTEHAWRTACRAQERPD